MRILYIADDGTQFDDYDACEAYEALLGHEAIYNIKFDDGKHSYKVKRGDEFDDSVYQRAEKVYVETEKELEDFQWLTKECGWCEFEQITSPGKWVRKDMGDMMGVWEKKGDR